MMFLRKCAAVAAVVVGAVFASALLIETNPAEACVHPSEEFKLPVRAGAQRGLILFDDGRQTMVIRPGYTIDTKERRARNDTVEGFTTLAWIIPVPSLPDDYREVDEKLFSELADFTKVTAPPPPPRRDNTRGPQPGSAPKPATRFHEPVKAGDYTIQPIEAKGQAGGTELNGWLQGNGFGKIDEAVLKHYLDNDYYWLAVKLHNPEGLPASGSVKPLLISFETETPVYPVKINQGGGAFDLELWVITRSRVDTAALAKVGLSLADAREGYKQKNRVTHHDKLPATVKTLIADDKGLNAFPDSYLYCYRFIGSDLGSKVDLAKLKSDFTFKLLPEAKQD